MKMEYPVDMKWFIKAENLNIRDVVGKINETTIPDVRYQLLLFCFGGASSIRITFLIHKTDNVPVEAEITASISSANKTYRLQKFTKGKSNKKVAYYSIVETKEEIMDEGNDYLVDGNLIFQIKGIIKAETLKRKYPFEETCLGCIMWKKSDKDFTFVIGDTNIRVHKFVMAEQSGYFEAMFNAAWIENEENQTTVTKFEYPIVEKAVKFCYDFPLIIDTEDEAISLLEFSDYYDIKTLKHEAECYLTEKLSAENVCDFANASVSSNSTVLRLCCINFLVKCLKDSTAVAGIDGLDADFKSQLLKHAFCTAQKL